MLFASIVTPIPATHRALRSTNPVSPGSQFKLGAGVLTSSLPWKGAGTKITAIPFIEASRGNWHFGGKGPVRYQTVVAGELGLTIGKD